MTHNVLYSQEQIALRVEELAKKIARAPLLPDIAMPVLVGGFIFAGDLVRALARQGVELEIEMLWLRSYGDKRVASAISMIAGPSEQIAGRHVLVIDGVLDFGRTIKKAVALIEAAIGQGFARSEVRGLFEVTHGVAETMARLAQLATVRGGASALL